MINYITINYLNANWSWIYGSFIKLQWKHLELLFNGTIETEMSSDLSIFYFADTLILPYYIHPESLLNESKYTKYILQKVWRWSEKDNNQNIINFHLNLYHFLSNLPSSSLGCMCTCVSRTKWQSWHYAYFVRKYTHMWKKNIVKLVCL